MAKAKKPSSWDNDVKDPYDWTKVPSTDMGGKNFGVKGNARGANSWRDSTPTKADRKEASKIVDEAIRGDRTDFSNEMIAPNFAPIAPDRASAPMTETAPSAGGLSASNAMPEPVPQAPAPAPARRGFSDLSPQEQAVASITHQGYKRGGAVKKIDGHTSAKDAIKKHSGGFKHHSDHMKSHAAGFKPFHEHVQNMCGGGMSKGKK